MRSVPTFAAMNETDPELAHACGQLRRQLRLVKDGLGASARAVLQGKVSAWETSNWRYFASGPARGSDGAIRYMHFFRHATLEIGGAPLSLVIPASAEWWPVGCSELTPNRTAPRAKLRLVS